MNIIRNLLTKGTKQGRPGTQLDPKGIVVHYVANPNSSAQANRNYFENGSDGRGVSAHYIIGLDGEIIQCVPENEVAYHATTANSTHIGIECCHPDASGKFNAKTYGSLIELSADICKRYKLDPLIDIIRHYDVSKKSCPLYYVNNESAWLEFLSVVNMRLKSENILYRVRKSASDAASQIGAFKELGNAKILAMDKKTDGFKVFDVDGKLVFNPATNIFVSINETEVLEKIVWCEARGEDLKGQILVVNVIINRLRSRFFPNTITDVVFQPMQFQPTRDGSFDKAQPTKTNVKAVQQALCGADYSQGALFFRTTRGATPDSWHEVHLTRLFDHMNHRFYK